MIQTRNLMSTTPVNGMPCKGCAYYKGSGLGSIKPRDFMYAAIENCLSILTRSYGTTHAFNVEPTTYVGENIFGTEPEDNNGQTITATIIARKNWANGVPYDESGATPKYADEFPAKVAFEIKALNNPATIQQAYDTKIAEICGMTYGELFNLQLTGYRLYVMTGFTVVIENN